MTSRWRRGPRLDRHEQPHRRREAQHDRSTSTTRRSVSVSKSLPNSTDATPTRASYRAEGALVSAGTSSTSCIGAGASTLPPPRFRLGRFVLQAFSERPSTPCACAHSFWGSPDPSTLARSLRASDWLSTFRSFATSTSAVRRGEAACRRAHPRSFRRRDGSRRARASSSSGGCGSRAPLIWCINPPSP